MSVINQVLNQLEQRGAHTVAEQTMVRAVPHTRRDFVMPLLVIGLALIAGIAAWQWVQMRKPKVVAVSAVQLQPVAAIPAPVSAVPASAAVAAAADSAVSAGEAPLAEMLPLASRLSFELSSVPLPSTLRPFDSSASSGQAKAQDRLRSRQATSLALSAVEGSGQALRDVKSIPAANPGASVQPAKEPVKPHSIPVAAANAKVAVQTSGGALPMKQVSPAQQADAEFRKAVALMQQGRVNDAMAGYGAALRLDAGHDAARQALVALLLEGKRNADAERVLQEGLNSKPEHTGFTMLLARLQVERGALEQATATLEKSLPYADAQADYQAFFAALLQRQNRHKEAITHYQIVLQRAPNNGVWLMGYGISLQAVQRNADAREAFKRALDTQTLSPELQAFVQQKLKGL